MVCIPGAACKLRWRSLTASLSWSVWEKLMPLPASESPFSLWRIHRFVPCLPTMSALGICGWKPAIEQSSGKMPKVTVAVGLVKMEMSLQSTKEIKVLTFLFKVHLYQKVNTPVRQCKYKLMCLLITIS